MSTATSLDADVAPDDVAADCPPEEEEEAVVVKDASVSVGMSESAACGWREMAWRKRGRGEKRRGNRGGESGGQGGLRGE